MVFSLKQAVNEIRLYYGGEEDCQNEFITRGPFPVILCGHIRIGLQDDSTLSHCIHYLARAPVLTAGIIFETQFGQKDELAALFRLGDIGLGHDEDASSVRQTYIHHVRNGLFFLLWL